MLELRVSRPQQRGRRAQLHADSAAVAWIVAVCVTVVAGTAMAMSFAGLAGVVEWTGLPSWARWTLPVALDGGMAAFTFAAFARRAEGRSATYPWSMVIVATIVSAVANAAHVVLPSMAGTDRAQMIVGAALMAFVPVWAALSAHQVADMIAPARPETARRPALAPVSSPVLDASPATAALAPRPLTPAPQRPVRPAPARATTTGVEARAEALRLAGEGMSQRQIAVAIGASKSSVARWLVATEVAM